MQSTEGIHLICFHMQVRRAHICVKLTKYVFQLLTCVRSYRYEVNDAHCTTLQVPNLIPCRSNSLNIDRMCRFLNKRVHSVSWLAVHNIRSDDI